MATYAVSESNLKEIGDAIRAKTGKTGTITVDNMASEIQSIPTGGSSERKGVCFTAEQANSTIKFTKNSYQSDWYLKTSTDGEIWTDYTMNTTITLSNIGDKVYFSGDERNIGNNNSTYYSGFVMTGKIAASGDIGTLISGREGFSCAPSYCYHYMFKNCTSLTTAPSLPATTIQSYVYAEMFSGCTSLTTIPELPATTLNTSCYYDMFRGCTQIKMSLTQDETYANEYTFGATPSTTYANYMFLNTGGSFTGTPEVQTLYTSNTIIPATVAS